MGFFNSLLNNVVDASKKIINKDSQNQTENNMGINQGMDMSNNNFSNVQNANVNPMPSDTQVNMVQDVQSQANLQMPPISNIPEMPPMQSTAGTTSGGYSQPEQNVNTFGANQGMSNMQTPTINPFDNGANSTPVPPMSNGMDNSYNPTSMTNSNAAMQQNAMEQNTNYMPNQNMTTQDMNSNMSNGAVMPQNPDFNQMPNPQQMNYNDMQNVNMVSSQPQETNQNSFMPNDNTQIQQGPKPAFYEPQNQMPQVPGDTVNQRTDTTYQQPVQQMPSMAETMPQNVQPTPTFIDQQSGTQQAPTNAFIDNASQGNFNGTDVTDNSTNNWGA